MRKHIGLIAVTLTAVTGAAAYTQAGRSDAQSTPITAPVTRGSIVDKVDATGTIQPVTTVQVGTQVSGTIKSLAADFNTRVHRGQVIAVLEPSLFQTQVDQAKATVAKLQADAERAAVDVTDSQAKLRRARELSAQQLLPASELDTADATARQAEAQVKSAQAQIVQARASLEQAQVNLGHTVITAPIDGIVVARSVDVGQTVAASMQAPTLFVIAQDLAHMQVLASVDESDIGRVQQGQAVSFTVDAYPGETFEGTVAQVRLQPTVDQNVVSYTTVIDVPNRSLKLKPGMTASVSIEIARADNVLRVPNSALRFRPASAAATTPGTTSTGRTSTGTGGGGKADTGNSVTRERNDHQRRVWIWKDGAMQAQRVETGLSDSTMTAIVGGGLTEGSEVVTGTAGATQQTATATTSPLLPARRGGPGGTRAGAGGGGR
jgi:HlyD family secretion protein